MNSGFAYHNIKTTRKAKSEFIINRAKTASLLKEGFSLKEIHQYYLRTGIVTMSYFQFCYYARQYNLSSLKNKSLTLPKPAENVDSGISASNQSQPVDTDITLSTGPAISKKSEPNKPFGMKTGWGREQLAKAKAQAEGQNQEAEKDNSKD